MADGHEAANVVGVVVREDHVVELLDALGGEKVLDDLATVGATVTGVDHQRSASTISLGPYDHRCIALADVDREDGHGSGGRMAVGSRGCPPRGRRCVLRCPDGLVHRSSRWLFRWLHGP